MTRDRVQYAEANSCPVENGPGQMKPRTLRGQKGGASGASGWGGEVGEDETDLVAGGVSGKRLPRLT